MENWLSKQAYLAPDRQALSYEGENWTFAELRKDVLTISGQLSCLKLDHSKRIGLLAGNTAISYMTILAIQQLGWQPVLFNTRLSADELAGQLHDADAAALLIDDSLKDRLDLDRRTNLSYHFLSELQSFKPAATVKIVENFHNQDIASIMFTSGTTGKAHGVLQTFGNHFYSAVGSAFNLGLHSDDQWLCTLPLFHISGLSIMARSLIYGMGVVLLPHFDAQKVTTILHERPIAIMSVVPTMLKQLLALYPADGYQSHFRSFLLGGEPIDAKTLDLCLAKGLPVIQSYGMTETCSQVVALNFQDADRKIGSVGKALFPMSLRVSNDDRSEVELKGPNIVPGYLGDPDAFQAKLTADGWFKTGDAGLIDDQGFLFIQGRLDDMFISGGENIFPNEIENSYDKFPAVQSIGVIGIPDDKWGQVPCAFVVAKSDTHLTSEQLIAYGRQHLAHYKVPKKYIFLDQLPYNASGKLLHRKLRRMYANLENKK